MKQKENKRNRMEVIPLKAVSEISNRRWDLYITIIYIEYETVELR